MSKSILRNIITTDGDYDVPESQIVEITCAKRGLTVRGIISSDVTIESSAKWRGIADTITSLVSPFKGSSGGASKAVTGITKLIDTASTSMGATFQQPWMSRKVWQGTEPLKFRVGVKFIAWEDAEKEVYLPTLYLLSLMYPRLLGSIGAGALAVGGFAAPGPGFLKGVGLNDDIVIKIGQNITYNLCYIEHLSVRWANTFNSKGMPMFSNVDISFSSSDTAYVKKDGSFELNDSEALSVDLTLSDMVNSVIDVFEGA